MSYTALMSVVEQLNPDVIAYEIRGDLLFVAHRMQEGDIRPLCYESTPDGSACRPLALEESPTPSDWPESVMAALTARQ